MPARTLALALLLLLCGDLAVRAAEPAGATVVLQLPPSMSPEAVRGLIADLATKGAQPAAGPADPPATGSPAVVTSAILAAQVWEATKQALRALPVLLQAPQIWVRRVEAEGGARRAALRFWVIALAGFMAAPLIGMGIRALLDRGPVVEAGLAPRLRAAFIRFLVAVAGLAVFAFLFCTALIGMLALSAGRPILEETADHLIWTALQWRVSIVLLTIIVSPRRPDLRLLAIDDADARVCSRWFSVYLAAAPVHVFAVWLVERLGFGQEVVFGAALMLGLVITLYKIAMFWATRGPIARAILAATGAEPGPVRRRWRRPGIGSSSRSRSAYSSPRESSSPWERVLGSPAPRRRRRGSSSPWRCWGRPATD